MCKLTDAEGLVNSVYPGIEHIWSKPYSWLCERAILAPTNEETTALNYLIQDKFEGEEIVYTAFNKTVNEDESVLYPTEYLATINVSGIILFSHDHTSSFYIHIHQPSISYLRHDSITFQAFHHQY